MARKKKEELSSTSNWPKIIRGSHSTRTEHEDGRVEFITHWDELVRDVKAAIADYEASQTSTSIEKPKRTRKK